MKEARYNKKHPPKPGYFISKQDKPYEQRSWYGPFGSENEAEVVAFLAWGRSKGYLFRDQRYKLYNIEGWSEPTVRDCVIPGEDAYVKNVWEPINLNFDSSYILLYDFMSWGAVEKLLKKYRAVIRKSAEEGAIAIMLEMSRKTEMKEEVDVYSGSFYVAVEGKKVKLILDEPLPKPIEVAMRGTPSKVTGKQNSFVIEWTHRVPVQLQPHARKENKMSKASEMIESVLEGKSPRKVVNEANGGTITITPGPKFIKGVDEEGMREFTGYLKRWSKRLGISDVKKKDLKITMTILDAEKAKAVKTDAEDVYGTERMKIVYK